jgi:hypothetical protein
MIACDNKNCPYEWFHFACVGLSQKPEGGKWYCQKCTVLVNGQSKPGSPSLSNFMPSALILKLQTASQLPVRQSGKTPPKAKGIHGKRLGRKGITTPSRQQRSSLSPRKTRLQKKKILKTSGTNGRLMKSRRHLVIKGRPPLNNKGRPLKKIQKRAFKKTLRICRK